jgi:tight adherence protein B
MMIALAIVILLGLIAALLLPTLRLSGARSKRLKALRANTGRSAATIDTAQQAAKKRRQVSTDALKALAEQGKQRRQRFSAGALMRQAGLEAKPTLFWIASAVMGLSLGVLAQLITGLPLLAAAAAFAGGLGLPRFLLGMRIAKRQKRFLAQLADGIEVIVRGIKSGLPLNQCLGIIAQEAPKPLSEEFKRLVDAQTMGVPLEQNLHRFHERMPLQEVSFFSTVIIIQQKSGGNLSEALGNLATVLRSRKMMREKVKALSGEAVASAGIIGSLPPLVGLVVFASRPEYISILWQRPEGQIALIGAGLWMACGIFVMRRMINFKI